MSETTHHTLSANGFDFGLRVYPATEPNGSVLVWLDGGAFMFGSLDMPEADEVARRLSAMGATVVSVDYTLGPLDGLAGLRRPAKESPGRAPKNSRPSSRRQVHDRPIRPRRCRPSRHSGGRGRTRTPEAPTPIAYRSVGRARAATVGRGSGPAERCRGRASASLLLVYPVLHAELPAADAELVACCMAFPQR